MSFPVSGIETYWWLPILVAFGISLLTSMGGISGAFMILPFQVSVLGFTSPGVTPTNLIFNIIAIPSGIYRYFREKRMVWPLALIIIIGTLPGLFLGVIIRIKYLPDPSTFKFFAGFVLLYIGVKLIFDMAKDKERIISPLKSGSKDNLGFNVTGLMFNIRRLSYNFNGRNYQASTPGIFILSLIVGVIGGIYGVGGGAFIAPFLVSVFGLPVYTIAGAALTGTFLTSVAGVIFYMLIAPYYSDTGLIIRPDWLLGLMFGIGGAIGMYTGARIQRFMPARIIKAILTICVLLIAARYIIGFF
ncbi:MAG: TSUP family transporter [candidate division Zixibacteria bacterium]|nr:sulfite exporter TauE/SafE family protein [candidate division Zixibacteria bacterium]NIR68167.1 sulfite exporter TauE/SafE family protein [candidate division Zixibacteria bacterium]NIS17912.1 sulfite exporter TauE/SafE family protein [candidate division Zixibacteria bacterium]NIS49379.1 sulfite exporter TauE/SafE family protein [candidate division Zixibacteria bacterium]NIU17457.1 sulfite exporter TauE/SafE family protein [candidate division Zixibacteria bacterium]